MEIDRALDQISEIHGHLARAEVYRGFRPVPVAFTGLLAIAAAIAAPMFVVSTPNMAMVGFWLVVAGACVGVAGADILIRYRREVSFARRKTERVVGQFVPCVFAGLAMTLALTARGGDSIALLPGIWTVLFAMGVFASRPYLPRTIGWVALFYAAGGFVLLAFTDAAAVSTAMGLIFGVGQLAAAWVLHRNLAREER